MPDGPQRGGAATPDPTPSIYNLTMVVMAALLVVAFFADMRMRLRAVRGQDALEPRGLPSNKGQLEGITNLRFAPSP